jgi:transcriptional regulator with XRE-family HTH domain
MTSKYATFYKAAIESTEYWTQVAILDFVRDLRARMDQQQPRLTRAALAAKLNTSPAYVTKVLRGEANFTLETMTKLALAVDGKIRIHISDRNAQTRWTDHFDGGLAGTPKASNALSVLSVPAAAAQPLKPIGRLGVATAAEG